MSIQATPKATLQNKKKRTSRMIHNYRQMRHRNQKWGGQWCRGVFYGYCQNYCKWHAQLHLGNSGQNDQIQCFLSVPESEPRTQDIPNAIVQTDIDASPNGERVIIKITRKLVNMLVELDPHTYKDYVECWRPHHCFTINCVQTWNQLVSKLTPIIPV